MIESLIIFFTVVILCCIQLNHSSQLGNILSVNTIISRGVFDRQHTTALRGIAILMIVVGHISGTFHTVVLNPIASVGVTLFMILSGYGLTCSYNKSGLKGFWQKKYLRVILPYFFVIIIWLMNKHEFSFNRFLLEVTGLQTTYWYIAYQIKWYLVFFIIMSLFYTHRFVFFVLSSISMFFFLPSLEAEQTFAFLIGVLITENYDKFTTIKPTRWGIMMLLFVITGALFLALKQLPEIRLYMGTKIYSAIQLMINLNFGLAIICGTCFFPKIRNSFLLLLSGLVSYEIYLLHFPFYGYVNGNILFAFALIIGSIIAAKIYSLFISKITDWLNRAFKYILS